MRTVPELIAAIVLKVAIEEEETAATEPIAATELTVVPELSVATVLAGAIALSKITSVAVAVAGWWDM